MATIAYGRVSTKDQTSDNQRLEIERAGFKVDYWFADEGVSGKTHASLRPQFKALLSQIRDGEILVVAKLDRLGRDAQDVNATITALAKRKIEVVILQLGKLDVASPSGKMMLQMLAAVAEMERDLLVERTQSGLARAKREGKVLGRPVRGRLRKRIIKYAKLCEGRSAYFLLAISPPLKDAHEIAAQHPPLFFDLT